MAGHEVAAATGGVLARVRAGADDLTGALRRVAEHVLDLADVVLLTASQATTFRRHKAAREAPP